MSTVPWETAYNHKISSNTAYKPLKTNNCHDANFVVTGGTTSVGKVGIMTMPKLYRYEINWGDGGVALVTQWTEPIMPVTLVVKI